MRSLMPRRLLLARAATVAPVAALPLAAASAFAADPSPDAALLALAREFEAGRDRFIAIVAPCLEPWWGDPDEARSDAALDAYNAIGDRIAATPALTPAGLAAKLRVLWDRTAIEDGAVWKHGPNERTDPDTRLLWDAIQDARAMGPPPGGCATPAPLPTPVAATGPAGPPDPHPAWWEEHRRNVGFINGDLGSEDDREAAFQRNIEIEDLIGETPATTLAGARTQVALAHYALDETASFNENDTLALANAIDTLDRLVGRTVS